VAEHRQLTHPPLREALIDIRIPEELPDSFIQAVAERTPRGFETQTKIWRGKWTFKVEQTKPEETAVTQDLGEQFGWRYDSKGGAKVVQLRRDGMTFSVLKGYTNWNEAKSSAQDLWRHYCEWGSPRMVNRLAVRYINVLELPPGADSDAYLTAGPRIPPELPQTFNNFLHRILIPFTPERANAIVTQALEAPLESGVPIVLDIDAFFSCTLAPDSPEIWTQLDRLREIKNRIFFASVTEKALEAYR